MGVFMSEETELKRELGIGYTTLFGVGLILGAGVYVLTGEAGVLVGDSLWLSVFFATIIAVLTGLSYAEFASMYPKAASSHTYVKETFPRREELAFISGWLIAFEGIAGAATAAIGFARYFVGIFSIDFALVPLIAIIVIIILSFVNWWGVKESAILILIFTFIEAFGLVFVSVLGLINPVRTSVDYFAVLDKENAFSLVLIGASIFYFAFTGFELQPTLAEEAKEPRKTVPKAIILALLICSALYLLVAFTIVRIYNLPTLGEDDRRRKAVLAYAAGEVGGHVAFLLVASIALFSTSNTVLGFLVSSSRLIYGLADERILPEKLARVHHKTRTPHYAVFASGIIAVLVIIITAGLPIVLNLAPRTAEGYELVLVSIVGQVSSLAALLVFVLINICVVVLRIRKPEVEREFKVPTIILPIVGAIMTAVFITSFTVGIVWITTAIIIVVGIVLYLMRPKH